MEKEDSNHIIRDFVVRQRRQLLAIATTLLLVLFLALLYRRPDLFGEFSRNTIAAAQVALIAVFVGFSIFNWRCPACKKALTGDVYRTKCNKCGVRLR